MRRIICTMLSVMLCVSLSGCRADSTASASPSASSSASASSDLGYTVLRVGMECAYAPNNWEEDTASDTNLPISNDSGFYAQGYDIQIARIIGEQLGVEIQVVKLSWDGLIQALNAGTIDLIIAGMLDTEERRQSISFTNTYGIGDTTYAILCKSTSQYASATSIQDFSGASILGQKGTYLDTVIDQIDNVNHISPVDSIPNMLDRLENDTVDGVVIDTDSGSAYLQTYPDLVMVEFADGQGFDLGYTGSCIGVRNEDNTLREAVNGVLATIDDDTRQAMMDQATADMPQ